MVVTFICVAAAWLACGLIGAGWAYAEIQAEYGERHPHENLGLALFFSFGGPVSLFAGFLLSGLGYYGWWKWGGKSKK